MKLLKYKSTIGELTFTAGYRFDNGELIEPPTLSMTPDPSPSAETEVNTSAFLTASAQAASERSGIAFAYEHRKSRYAIRATPGLATMERLDGAENDYILGAGSSGKYPGWVNIALCGYRWEDVEVIFETEETGEH